MKPGRRSPKSSNYDSKKMVAYRGQAEGESQGNQTPTVGALVVYLGKTVYTDCMKRITGK